MPDSPQNTTSDPIVLLGAGGHAKVVADAILSRGTTVAGFYDDASEPALVLPGASHLGPLDAASSETRLVILAIGDLSARRAVLDRHPSLHWASAVHASAIVSPRATLQPGALIAPRAVVNPGVTIGPHAIINTGAIVEHDCTIGENAHLGPGAILSGGVRIGPDTLIGSGAIVLPGISIGSGCVVGAGAVVTADLPDGCRAVGVPARVY